ncbi:MAG: hypothetical protein INQ03_11335 [Candidatus Heimdallarchaeota archaeon]|nr:hypothetical protein [Candidatus Heimdallarchaeota archaeon]
MSKKQYNKRIKFDEKFDPNAYFSKEQGTKGISGDIKYLLINLGTVLFFGTIIAALFVGIAYVLSKGHLIYVADSMINLAVLIIALAAIYVSIGFRAGSALYSSSMWINAWTNKSVSGGSALRDLRNFVSIGRIMWSMLIGAILTFLIFYSIRY